MIASRYMAFRGRHNFRVGEKKRVGLIPQPNH